MIAIIVPIITIMKSEDNPINNNNDKCNELIQPDLP
jgi:hypothetical protein